MASQLPLDETFILSIWLELVLYGLYFGLFSVSVFVAIGNRTLPTQATRIMFASMLVMFFLATIHVFINLYRLLRGYVWLRDAPGGPAAYFGDLARWDHIFKDSVYVAQSIIGDTVVIYRCWIVWEKNHYIIALPMVLLISNTVCGIYVCWLFSKVSGASIFASRLTHFISTFFALGLTQNIITTSLIAFRIWRRDHAVSTMSAGSGRSSLMPVVAILVESAVVYAGAMLILVILYALNQNAQYILLEAITPIVGLVFVSITLRLPFRDHNFSKGGSASSAINSGDAVNIAMRPMTVRITRKVHSDLERDPGSGEDGQIFPSDK